MPTHIQRWISDYWPVTLLAVILLSPWIVARLRWKNISSRPIADIRNGLHD